MKKQRLWVITSYFNPAGWKRRREIYKTFRSRLNLPLLTIEHTHRNSFQLTKDDADVMIQLRGGDVMW